jgi:two-component system response regulator AtoC
MSRPAILVVDDDRSIRTYLSHFLSSRGYAADCLESGEQAIAYLAAGNTPAVVILDIIIPGMDGLEVLSRIKKTDPALPVIILSALGQIKTVVDAMKAGASDYLVKPFEDQELELAIGNVLEKQKLQDEVKNLRRQLDQFTDQTDILSSNPKMVRIREIAKQVADTDVPVLILGESGVGKEVVARYIHAQTARREKPFVKVNCAALPHDLLESELFGYERGAFTGALREKPGKFELADKGCILLDEIAEMSPQLQAKLLHVLQDGEYSRLGAKRPMRVDARVLASTNKRLEDAVSKGEFREDLYFRLNVIKIEIPPLRERREDIPLLCTHFLEIYREKYRNPAQTLPRELLEAFLRYDWPGNVRQLENAIKRFVILPDLDMAFSELKSPGSPVRTQPQENLSLKDVAAQAAEQAERDVVLRVLEDTNWNRKQSARKLGICYKALLNKLKKWQIDNRPRQTTPLAKAS